MFVTGNFGEAAAVGPAPNEPESYVPRGAATEQQGRGRRMGYEYEQLRRQLFGATQISETPVTQEGKEQ